MEHLFITATKELDSEDYESLLDPKSEKQINSDQVEKEEKKALKSSKKINKLK